MVLATILSLVVGVQGRSPDSKVRIQAKGSSTSRGKMVTTGQVRMSDLGIVGRLNSTSGGTSPLRLFERSLGAGKTGRPAAPRTLPKDYKWIKTVGPIDEKRKKDELVLFTGVNFSYAGFYGLGAKKTSTFDADFGSAAKGEKDIVGHYDGVATSAGKVTATKVKGGPFTLKAIRVYSGYYVNGKPEVESESTGNGVDLSANVKAGQEYQVLYAFNNSTAATGSYKGTSTVDDGAITNMSIHGNCVAPFGGISESISSEVFNLYAGQSVDVPVTLSVSGNSKATKVSLEVVNYADLFNKGIMAIPSAPLSVSNGASGTMHLKLTGMSNLVDGQYNVTVKYSGYDGSAFATFNVPVSAKTLWIDSGNIVTSAGNVTTNGRLRFNSLGYYDWSGVASTSSKFTGDEYYVLFMIDPPIEGYRLSVSDLNYLSAKFEPGPSSKPFSQAAYSPYIKDHFKELIGSTFKTYVVVNDSASMEGARLAYKTIEMDGHTDPWFGTKIK